jgi:hypothetical protein
MCDPELIAAILEELGYLNEKKEQNMEGKNLVTGSIRDYPKNGGEGR